MPSDVIQTRDHKIHHPKPKPQQNPKRTAPIQLDRVQLVETVACILDGMIEERLTRYTDISEVANQTSFHAQKVPAISIKDYLKRFADNSKCHEDAFVYALIYLDKVGEILDEFALDTFNAHRMILICLVTACKFYDDYYYKNSYYAKIGGIKLDEFNKLEQEFLVNYIQFSLYVKSELYTEYYQDLVNYHVDRHHEENDAC